MQLYYFLLERSFYGNINYYLNVIVVVWWCGDYWWYYYWCRDVFFVSGYVWGVVFLVNGGVDFYLVLYVVFWFDDFGS